MRAISINSNLGCFNLFNLTMSQNKSVPLTYVSVLYGAVIS